MEGEKEPRSLVLLWNLNPAEDNCAFKATHSTRRTAKTKSNIGSAGHQKVTHPFSLRINLLPNADTRPLLRREAERVRLQ